MVPSRRSSSQAALRRVQLPTPVDSCAGRVWWECKSAILGGNTWRRKTTVLHARATPERLSMFSDGVFAVLITVLVLDLRPPELPTFKALLLLWPTWLSYAVSYLFIAIVWTNHHHLLRYATEATPRLMWLALNGATADRPQLRTLTFASTATWLSSQIVFRATQPTSWRSRARCSGPGLASGRWRSCSRYHVRLCRDCRRHPRRGGGTKYWEYSMECWLKYG